MRYLVLNIVMQCIVLIQRCEYDDYVKCTNKLVG